MVFSVNIVSNSTADGYVFSARSNGEKPAVRNNQRQNLCQRGSCFATKNSVVFVERKNASKQGCVEQYAVFIQAGVAIAATLPKREHRLFIIFERKRRGAGLDCYGLRVFQPGIASP